MTTQELIEVLGYKDNPAFLQGKRLEEHHGYSFFFTQAEKQESCNLKGVYALLDSPGELSSSSLTPVVYICEAENEDKAQKIHQRVWNQNIVPFLLVVTPKKFRLYSGFEYDRNQSDKEQFLEVTQNAKEVLNKLSAFKSEAIDSSDIWKQKIISTEKRVDRHLLSNLKKLANILIGSGFNLPIEQAHTLIGKYIYLKYLRDRGILSDKRLSDANVCKEDIYSIRAKKQSLYQLEEYLNVFLNGSVFPLPSRSDIETKHVKKVAGVFNGDDPESGQQFLFDIYDFSYVPIETLSVVYQQFLHQKDEGRKKSAYYTPVHLVNFILDELNAKKPLKKGMKIFDPSCGSGAFLVQCYRRLVEGIIRGKRKTISPKVLKKLLVDNIFGLDADEEACRVAELSLSLTLLDYIKPPDLCSERHKGFKLPGLHNRNIFHCKGGFFDDNSLWTKSIPKEGYDWIVGNPPWKNINKKEVKEQYDCRAIEWIDANKNTYPVDNYQVAEAFSWKTTQLLKEDGQCGLLMPAMTLFKLQGHLFRAKFFSEIETWCIVNFANIRRYLFEEAINPAAAFFYSGKKNWNKSEHYITTYAPFAIEQSSQLNQTGETKRIWSVFVNYSTIKEVPLRDIKDGSSVPWKIAMWGLHRDELLTKYAAKRFPPLIDYTKRNALPMYQGLDLRYEATEDDEVLANELRGQSILAMEQLEGYEDIHQFPLTAFEDLPKDKNIYTRKGRKEKSLTICNPPHIFVDAARRFVVYSEKFFIIPPRQIGIAGYGKQKILLKALALYLKSDFVKYQQWMTCAAWGIERDRPNLEDLKKLPIPLSDLSDIQLAEWAQLHDNIVEAEKRKKLAKKEKAQTLWSQHRNILSKPDDSLPMYDDLLKQMNDNVYNLLGMSKKQQWLVEDMLNVRMKLNDGVFDAKEVIGLATKKAMEDFARIFQEELDLFLDHSGKTKVHNVKVYYADNSTVMIVDHLKVPTATEPEVLKVEDNKIQQVMNELQEKLAEVRSQWMYFTRCLQIHKGRRIYIFKPRQRLYWLKSQALAEADDFIEEKLTTKK